MSYPILVERFVGNQGMTIICQACHTEEVIEDPNDLLNDGYYSCPALCGKGSAVYKFEEASRCKGCGELGFYDKALDYCCSRRCQLQGEYAQALASRESV